MAQIKCPKCTELIDDSEGTCPFCHTVIEVNHSIDAINNMDRWVRLLYIQKQRRQRRDVLIAILTMAATFGLVIPFIIMVSSGLYPTILIIMPVIACVTLTISLVCFVAPTTFKITQFNIKKKHVIFVNYFTLHIYVEGKEINYTKLDYIYIFYIEGQEVRCRVDPTTKEITYDKEVNNM